MSAPADLTTALGRMNSALGAVTIAAGAALQAAERREREADRREREAAAAIADAERRVEHLVAELARERAHKNTTEYRRGYLAGRNATRRGAGSSDLQADADDALRRRRNKAQV
jgi:cell division septum initiation protein DivIVA